MTLTASCSNVNDKKITASASTISDDNTTDELIPGGQVIGVTMESSGILVLGTGSVTGEDRHVYTPAGDTLKAGDIILMADGIELNDKEALMNAVDNCNSSITLTVLRKDSTLDIKLTPVKCIEDGSQKIGVWVRDSTQGIGTLTYINPDDMTFGALGHGVYDADTEKLMSLKEGSLVGSSLSGIRKSQKGSPGELTGILNKNIVYGNVISNTEHGIYGSIENNSFAENAETLPVADFDEVTTGDAVIRCSLDGINVEEYKIQIKDINKNAENSDKCLVLKITDDWLIDKAGGIVQGMSGSPIIQNGKIIGAVTHVFVNEPTKGYGIFIGDMLKAEK